MIFNRLKKINSLLTQKEKTKGIILLLMIMIMGFFDVLGIASIMPFMSLASDPNFIESNQYAQEIYNFFEFKNKKRFIFFSGLSVIALIVISSLIKLMTIYAMYNFTFKREYSISLRLLKGYLNQPYDWFLNQHSAELSKSVLADVREVIARSILTSILVISNIFLAILIISLLIIVDPLTAISAFLLFGLIYLILYFSVKNILDNIGIDRLAANTERFKVSNETFSLIKEIKVLGKENFYLSIFDKSAKKFVEKEILMQSISSLPKYFIEMVVFAAMISIILINLADDLVLSTIIPIVALYAFAVYRLIPALQVIFSNISLFKSSASVLDFVSEKYEQLDIFTDFKDISSRLKFQKEITFDNMSFYYPKTKKEALSKINLKIPANNIVGIIGATGSGKTTVLNLLLGLFEPSEGNLLVDETKIYQANVRDWQSCIGYVPQHISLIDESISANIALGEGPEDLNMDSVISAAKVANIHEFINSELENGYKTKIGEKGVRLSGGQRQRLGIARALYNNPDVLVLDEATSSLDGETEEAVMDAVNNLGRKLTIIIVAHRLSTLAKADIVYKLKNGQIHSQGSYEEMCR